ncbi:hypothetical protein HY008_03120 [Candidatus Woesebacteria bacterium]|nr:hypothetical protein [Candidatus Woesebacteria bacterium]
MTDGPASSLLIILILISSFSLLGALIAYIFLPKVKANEKLWEIFAFYLMILLSFDLLATQLVKNIIIQTNLYYLFKGFLVGFMIIFLLMQLYSFITRNTKSADQKHNHIKGVSTFVFLILAIHEVAESASVAELLHEVSVTSISISTSLFPFFILALHEFPEGMLLVTPFFLEKRIKSGIYASIANQILFIVSGLIIYHLVLRNFEPSVAQDEFLHTLPAGGIFYLGIHELRNSITHRGGLKFFYTDIRFKLVSLLALVGVLGSLFLLYDNVYREKTGKGFVVDPVSGEHIDYNTLCERGVDLRYCLSR